MAKIISVVLLIFLLLSLGSCREPRVKIPWSFSGDFDCEYSYVLGGTLVRARLSSFKGDCGRETALSFIEPKTLSGIVCTRCEDGWSAELFGVDMTKECAEGLALSSTLFFEPEKTEFCGRVEINGEALEHFRCTSYDGREVSVYIDGKTELPVKISGEISGRSIELSVISFEASGD